MRKVTVFFVLLALMAVALVPAFAQTEEPTEEPTTEATTESTPEATTAEPTTEVTAEATVEFVDVPTVLVRLAHFASDGPALAPFVDGQPSGIQGLEYPSMTGWVEVPAGAALSLVPQSDTSAAPVVGPIVLDSSSNWSTIAVTGTVAGGLNVYAIPENLSDIPEGCALVTVFHAINGAPAFDVVGSEGTTFSTGIGFPGSDAGMVSDPSGQCAPAMSGTGDPMATDEPMAAASNVTVGAIDCVLLPTMMSTTGSTDMAATEDPMATEDASATEEASTMPAQSLSGGQTVSNCAYSFVVPAGLTGLNANGADGAALFSLSNTAVEANTYYFFAVIGTPDAPQVFSYSVAGDNLGGLMDMDSDDMSTDMDATMEMTTEPTAEATEAS